MQKISVGNETSLKNGVNLKDPPFSLGTRTSGCLSFGSIDQTSTHQNPYYATQMTRSTQNEDMNEKLSTKNLSSHLSSTSDPKSDLSAGAGENFKLAGKNYVVFEKRIFTMQEAQRMYEELIKTDEGKKARSTQTQWSRDETWLL